MTLGKPTSDPLVEWNRLNKENHENFGAAKMFVAFLTRFPAELGNYASWFTAGVGAVVVLLLSNVDKIAPYLGEAVYARAITAFAIAVGLGALAKLLAVYVAALIAMQEELNREILTTLQAFDSDATKIQDIAKQRNIDLKTDFNLAGLMEKFQSQLGPITRFVVGWAVVRAMRSKNPVLHRFRMPIRLAQIEMCCFVLSIGAAAFGAFSVTRTISDKAWGARQSTVTAPARGPADPVNFSTPGGRASAVRRPMRAHPAITAAMIDVSPRQQPINRPQRSGGSPAGTSSPSL